MKFTSAAVLAASLACVVAQRTVEGEDAAIACIKKDCFEGQNECANECLRTNIKVQTLYVPINNAKNAACKGLKEDPWVECIQAVIEDPTLRTFTPSGGTSTTDDDEDSSSSTTATDASMITSMSSTASDMSETASATMSETSSAAAAEETDSGASHMQAGVMAAGAILLAAAAL